MLGRHYTERQSVSIRGKVAIFDDPRHFLVIIDEKKPSCTWIQITEIAAFELEGAI